MKAGIVGVPNAGKSTLFNAIMKKSQAVTANYPFCTIEPNIGKVPVADGRLCVLSTIVEPEKIVNTRLDCVDIAGLIKGAANGEGLGNSFLENIRDIDLILHVVRAFKNTDTGEAPDVLKDIDTVVCELMLSDMQKLEKFLTKQKGAKTQEVDFAKKALGLLEQGKRISDEITDPELLKFYRGLGLLTIKPYLLVANVEEEAADISPLDNRYLHELAEKHDVLVCSACFEYELTQVPELQVGPSAIDKIIQAAYKKLDLITFFTAGKEEVRAWTTKRDSLIPDAAGVIHTDFRDKFIRAEVVSYDDFVAYEGWEGAKAAGKLRVEGKQYQIQDADVCFFKI